MRKFTEAHRKNLSLAHLGKKSGPHSAETKAKIGAAHKGRIRPAEWCEKLRLGALKRAPKSADERARISAALKGRKYSPETIERYRAAAQRREGATTPELLKVADFMRSCVYRLKSNSQTQRTREILGYTREELRIHLEAQFVDGMTWFNYGKKGWHIDHIYPVARFVKAGIVDPKIVNALANLRPLWARDNHRKSSKVA
jgi:NUMOD3 motif-containing protein